MATSTTPLAPIAPLTAMTAPAHVDPRALARRALWSWASALIAGVVLAYLLIIGLSPNVLWPTPFALVTLGLFGALTGAWIWVRGKSAGAQLGRTPWAIAAFLAVGSVSAVASLDPARSWSAWWQMLALGAVFLMAADLFAGPRRDWVHNALLWAGGLSMLWTWLQVFGWYSTWLSLNPQAWLSAMPYRLQNPNQIALQLALVLLLAVTRFAAGPLRARLWLTPYIVSDLALLFLSSSRGGWIGAAVGLGALAATLVGRKGILTWSQRLRAALRKRAWLVGVGLLVGAIAVAGAGRIILKQLDQPTRGGRLEYWIPALETFAAHPWLGQGQATFAVSFMRSQTAPPAVVYNHAHSIYLNTLAESGLLGALGGLALIAAISACVWRRRTDTDPAAQSSFALGAAALALYLAHGVVENVAFDRGNVLVLVLLLAGCLGSATGPSSARARRGSMAFTAVLAAAALALGAFGVWRDDPAHRGAALADAGDWAGAADAFAEATRRDPASPAPWQQLALAEARLAATDPSTPLAPAIAALEHAVALDPNWPANALNLGALDHAAGDDVSARLWMQRAVEAAPLVPLYHVNLGRLLEDMGDADAASAAYAEALTLAPEQATAPFWRETTLRQTTLASWQARHTSSVVDLAPAQLVVGLSDSYLLEAEHTQALGDLDRAEYWLGMADLGYWARSDARLRWAWRLAEVKAARGDVAGALALMDRLSAILAEPSSFGPGTGGGSVYGTYVALRPTMQAELVPQVLDLTPTIDWPARFQAARAWCADVAPDARPSWCTVEALP